MGKRKLEPTAGDQEQEKKSPEAASTPSSQGPDSCSDNSSEQEHSSEDLHDSSSGSEDGSGSSSGPEVSDEDVRDDSDDSDKFDNIDVNFEFFDPKESDFHGLKALLHSYLDGQQYDSSQMIDAIIQQSQVGTVVRTGEDEDPIAVMTVLNTQQHSSAGFMQQIKQHMLSKCQDEHTKQLLLKAWQQPGTGLVINERLINCPPQLAPPLVQALFSEISWATEDEPTQERRDKFKFKQYLVMTRVFSDPLPPQQQQGPAGAGKPPKAPQQPAKKQKQQHSKHAPIIVYVRPEDEFFHKSAAASFTFPVEGRAVGKDELQPQRLVLLLPATQVPTARAALDEIVGNMAARE